nr:MAG TPA: hypothetical protein [Caudoviricetes sp.]
MASSMNRTTRFCSKLSIQPRYEWPKSVNHYRRIDYESLIIYQDMSRGVFCIFSGVL